MFGFFGRNPIPDHAERIWTLGLHGGAAARARFQEKQEEVNVDVLGLVIWEFECLHILLTDRVVFKVLGAAHRDPVMNRLIDWCIDDYVEKLGKNFSDDQKQNRKQMMNQRLCENLETLGRCPKIAPEIGEPPRNTILYEFCTGMTLLMGHEGDFATHLQLMKTVTDNLNDLHADDFALAAKRYGKF